MNERFDLAPWEVPRDSLQLLQGVADNVCLAPLYGVEEEVAFRKLTLYQGLNLLFCRAVVDEDQASWVAADSHRGRLYPAGWPNWFGIEGLNLWSFVRTHWAHAFFGRGCLVLLFADGRGSWLPLESEELWENRAQPFLWHRDERNWAQEQAAKWLEHLRPQLQEPDSQISMARHFSKWDQQKRLRFLLTFAQGDVDELRQVLQWLLLCDSERADDSQIGATIYAHKVTRINNDVWEEVNSSFVPNPTLFSAMWEGAIEAYFQPRVNTEHTQNYPCAKACLEHSEGQDKSIAIFVGREEVSQHERLEAALELRAWARGKVPDELLETLL